MRGSERRAGRRRRRREESYGSARAASEQHHASAVLDESVLEESDGDLEGRSRSTLGAMVGLGGEGFALKILNDRGEVELDLGVGLNVPRGR